MSSSMAPILILETVPHMEFTLIWRLAGQTAQPWDPISASQCYDQGSAQAHSYVPLQVPIYNYYFHFHTYGLVSTILSCWMELSCLLTCIEYTLFCLSLCLSTFSVLLLP